MGFENGMNMDTDMDTEWVEKPLPDRAFTIGKMRFSEETAKSMRSMGVRARMTPDGRFLCFVVECNVCHRTETTNMLPEKCVGINNCPRAKITICSGCCGEQCPEGIRESCPVLSAVKGAL